MASLKSRLSLSMAALAALLISAPAQADYAFSGSGSSGVLVGASETWLFNADGGYAKTQYLDNWGSPGVGAGTVQYGETLPAYGMTLTFTGSDMGAIDSASVGIGNTSACAGGTSGGTTFCTILPTDIWLATITGPDSIEFTAQNPTYFLSQDQYYFVNVFFDNVCPVPGAACVGGAPTAFTGAWLTEYSPVATLEPFTLSLFGAGLAGAAALSRRKRKSV